MLNDMIMDASIDKVGSSEREMAIGHPAEYRRLCPENEGIVLFDRGYPSSGLIKELEKAGLKYVMRVGEKWNVRVDGVTKGDTVPDLDEAGRIRVMRFRLGRDTEETLITNVYELGYKSFKRLYFMRWPIETK